MRPPAETATIKLVTVSDRVVPCAGRAGLLFECAPDSPILNNYPDRLELGELIGDIDAAKLRAYQLTRLLLQDEPAVRGIRQLGIFEESVIGQLRHAFHLIHLHGALLRARIRLCRFDSASHWAQGLKALAGLAGSDIEVVSPLAGGNGSGPIPSLFRSLKRLAESGLSPRSLKEEWSAGMDRVDPYRRRWRFLTLAPPAARARGGNWFYSTSYTFTQIGMSYEPYFPGGLNYLVRDSLTGGRRLQEAGRRFSRLHDFAAADMEPSRREIAAATRRIIEYVERVPLAGDDDVARRLLLQSGWFHEFLHRQLPRGLHCSALFDRWLDEVRPAALVVGNPVHEGYALHMARKKGVATVLLQHGILGDYCQFCDPPVDRYMVRGRFWQEFLAPAARAKSVILNPPEAASSPPESVADADRHILFITASYQAGLPILHLDDLEDIVLALLRAAAETGRALVVRVHPSERLGTYESLVRRLLQTHSIAARVSYSQGPGLSEVVAGAAVAITYGSTVFLDCLRLGVPIIAFGWHRDLSFRKQIEKYGVFHFAGDLRHLGHLVAEAVAGRLHGDSRGIHDFLAPSGADELHGYFADLTQ